MAKLVSRSAPARKVRGHVASKRGCGEALPAPLEPQGSADALLPPPPGPAGSLARFGCSRPPAAGACPVL